MVAERRSQGVEGLVRVRAETARHADAMEQVVNHARTAFDADARIVYGAGWVALVVAGREVARERDADFGKAVARLGALATAASFG